MLRRGRSCETLGDFPLKGRSRNDLQKGLRILGFERKAVITYRVLADEVEVTNIFYGGRNWEAIISDSKDENPVQQHGAGMACSGWPEISRASAKGRGTFLLAHLPAAK